MPSKIDIINGMFKLIRISGLTSKAIPEEIEVAIQVADDYAGELLSMGLDVGWFQPSEYGQSDPNDLSGLDPQTAGPFKKLLAKEVVDYFGKQMPVILQTNADKGLRSLEQLLVNVGKMQNPATLPIGSGNQYRNNDIRFYPEPDNDDGAINKNINDVFQLPIDWSSFLVGLFTLDSVEYNADSGITLANEAIVDDKSAVTLSFSRVGQFTLCVIGSNSNGDKQSISIKYNVKECN